MKGRKPIPTQLHKLHGNPGKRSLNKNEPKPKGRKPTCPNHLQGAARYEWDRVCDKLRALGLLTGIDRAALSMYCIAYGTVADAQKKIDQLGTVYKTKSGAIIQSPYIGIRNRAMELAYRFMVEFGMTPSSRSRMDVGKEITEEEKAMDEWLKRARERRESNGR